MHGWGKDAYTKNNHSVILKANENIGRPTSQQKGRNPGRDRANQGQKDGKLEMAEKCKVENTITVSDHVAGGGGGG